MTVVVRGLLGAILWVVVAAAAWIWGVLAVEAEGWRWFWLLVGTLVIPWWVPLWWIVDRLLALAQRLLEWGVWLERYPVPTVADELAGWWEGVALQAAEEGILPATWTPTVARWTEPIVVWGTRLSDAATDALWWQRRLGRWRLVLACATWGWILAPMILLR